MHLTPNAGTAPDNSAFVPRLDYQVVFAHAGTNYLWGRGAAMDTAADSCYFALDFDFVVAVERRIGGFRNEWTWYGLGTLPTADAVTGPWTDLGCPSPLVETPAGNRKFFRLRR